MKCPRCKGENPENAVVCASCNLKLQSPCPRCKSFNKIGQSVCSNCNLKLLRFCPQCKAPNFPNVKNCRKCGFELIKTKSAPQPEQEIPQQVQKAATIPQQPQVYQSSEQQVKEEQIPEIQPEPQIPEAPQEVASVNVVQEIPTQAQEISQHKPQPQQQPQHYEQPIKKNYKEFSRTEAHDAIINLIKTSDQGMIVDLGAADGGGKSTLVSSVTQSLKDHKLLWLIGVCQPLNQLLPYSFLQDLFKTFMSLPQYVSNLDESKSTLQKILETSLEIKDEEIFKALSRILFNDFSEASDSIEENKDFLHKTIIKFFDLLNEKANLAIIIEDFEFIDNASLEFFNALFDKGFLTKKNFVIINHQPNINLHEIFAMQSLKKKLFSMVLYPMSFEEFNSSLIGMLNNQDIIPQNIKNKIYEYSKNIPLYMEQVLWYLFQTGALISGETSLSFNPQASNIELPAGVEELIAIRTKLIANSSPDALNILMSASVFGSKFLPPFVQVISTIEEKQFNNIVQLLINNGVFVMMDQVSLRFKHGLIWRIIYEQFFNDEQIINYGTKLLEFYGRYTTNINSSILARHAEEAGLKPEMYHYSGIAAMESLAFGDAASYTELQNKVLELLPEVQMTEEEKLEIRIQIEEQLGRANYEFNPKIAADYLSNSVLIAEKQNNPAKVIDLTGYLARSCELSGNYAGVIECCDKALSIIDQKKYELETILLNYYKLDATYNLGRLEETIVMANNEVLSSLNNYISSNQTIKGIEVDDLVNIEYESALAIAKAYVCQGNKQALDLTKNIAEKAQKDSKTEYEIQALLLNALFYSLQGNISESNNILEEVKPKFNVINAPEKLKLYWYFVAIISSSTNGHFQQAKDLCEVAIKMANIFKDYNLLTLLRLILGKCFEEFGRPAEAHVFYEETVNFASEHKMATGALFSWYLAANQELTAGVPDRACEIAERALEIAQKPNINNFIAEILLNLLIAKSRTVRNDFEGAQINIETAISLAEKNDLTLFLVSLYIAFGEIYRKHAEVDMQNIQNFVNVANRLYNKALIFAEQIENHFCISNADKAISELHLFCKKNNLQLENIN
jgi:tetratricopeptide (TPR) repeat protein